MSPMHRYVRVAAACLIGAVLAVQPGQRAQAQPQAQPAPAAVPVRGAGATFPAPLYRKWIETFQQEHRDAAFSYDAVGSGEGIRLFMNGAVDFGASDAALSDEEIARVGRGALLIPATAGMVVLAYNIPGVTGPLRLPRDVYADIFAGKIRSWNDPKLQRANPDLSLPNLDIVLVARLDRSGTTYALSNHLSAISESWRNGPGVGTLIDWPGETMRVRGNEGVAARIKISDGAIGYVEYGFAKRLGLPLAVLQNQAGSFVRPDEASGRKALAEATDTMTASLRMFAADPSGPDSYPIVTYTWLLLYGRYPDAAKRTALKSFVTWGLTRGQDYSAGLGYLPLPDTVAARGIEALERIQ